MESIVNRLASLRKAMEAERLDFYLITTADYHNSEYVGDYFKAREYFSGFTGSNGNLLVFRDGAGLWTDGRYFIQAQAELAGSGITLYRMGEEGVPTLTQFLEKQMQAGQRLGFDGRTLSIKAVQQLQRKLPAGCEIVWEKDLAGQVWKNRPMMPHSRLQVLPDTLTGETVEQKLERVKRALAQNKADLLLLTKLDDLMWLFNVRGRDVACNPVALSYACISEKETVFFVQKSALGKEAEDYFKEHDICVREYGEITDYLSENLSGKKVLTDDAQCSYALGCLIKKYAQDCLYDCSPTEKLKAVKNAAELSHMEEIYLKDSVVLTKFIFWLKKNIGKIPMTESSAAAVLDAMRAEIPGFLELSFPTIAAYQENAAMMHYEAVPGKDKVLEPEGMLLVDSGGQYIGGTTDVTRTVVLGVLSEQVRLHYTKTTEGMLRLAHAKWLYGCSGRNLDILARGPLWELGMDYKCGTGHGVGYMLNVHEGPQRIGTGMLPGAKEAVLEAGMTISDEPGVYVEGSHGIRIENILVVQKDEKTSDGQFMRFHTLTYVPIDLAAIEPTQLSAEGRQYLNDYHRQVYEKISPYLNEDEAAWLREETREI